MTETGSQTVSAGLRDELQVLGAASRWVRDDDVDLHVLDYGGPQPPLLVLPGITSPAITWDFVVAELRDLVRPIVMDLRGRGLSGCGDRYGAGDFADDAAAVITQLGLEAPIVLGHSLGARIAAALLAREGLAARGTIVIDPPVSGPGRGLYPTSREAFQAQLDEGHAGTTADAVRRFYPKWPRAELLLRARWLRTCNAEAVLATYDRFTVEDFFDWWPSVPAPAAVFYGGESPVVTDASAAEIAAANPEAELRRIEGAGHMVPWDNYPVFMSTLRSTLAGQLAGTGSTTHHRPRS